MLCIRVQDDDCVLGEHFKTAAKNAQYTSKTVQNEISACLEAIAHSTPMMTWIGTAQSFDHFGNVSVSLHCFTCSFSKKIHGNTRGLSVKLQGRYVGIVWAHQDIKSTVKGVRSRVDSFHSLTYQQAVMLGQSMDAEETPPRQTVRQQHHQNISSNSISEHYKRSLTYTFWII